MRELMRWLDRVNDTQRPARLDRFLERYGDADTRNIFAALQHDLYRGATVADRHKLLESLGRIRRLWQEENRRCKVGRLTLPPLNGPHSEEI
jgi:hypothetical protein